MNEYWIPAVEVREFNANLLGRIEVVAEIRRSGVHGGPQTP